MTTITEAVFRGRNQRVIPTPSDSLRNNPNNASSQFMARRAVEAVLAGGYTRADQPPPAATPLIAQPASERRSYVRDAVIWVFVFAVAGVIGIATGHLPGHAVQAKPAEHTLAAAPAAVAQAALQTLESAPAPAPTASAPAPPVAAAQAAPVAAPVAVAAAPAPPVQEVAMVVPAAAPRATAVLHPVSKAAGLIAAVVADNEPLTARTASAIPTPPPAAVAPQTGPAPKVPVPMDEVLYEGEPATAAAKAPTASVALVAPRAPRPATAAAAPAEESTPAANGAPRVEGIFWDKVRPLALVNGAIVEVGKQIGEMKVLEIQPGLVVLDNAGLRLELRP